MSRRSTLNHRVVGICRVVALMMTVSAMTAVFTRSTFAQYDEIQKIVASDSAPGSGYGQTVALDGDLLVTGAQWAASSEGAVYVYRFDGSSWGEVQQIPAPAGSDGMSRPVFVAR